MMNNNYQLRVQLLDISEITDELEDRLFKAGCNDCLICLQNGNIFLDFSRDGDSYQEAVRSVSKDLTVADFKFKVYHETFITDDEWKNIQRLMRAEISTQVNDYIHNLQSKLS